MTSTRSPRSAGRTHGRTLAGLLLAASALMAPALPAAAADVGISVQIGQPGFYGVIDIGDFQRPVLVSPQPVIVVQGERRGPPRYLHVPPGHRKDWRKHCGRYDACGVPVYFVRQDWYEGVYAPDYRRRAGFRDQGDGRNDGRYDGRNDGRDRDDRHERGGRNDDRRDRNDRHDRHDHDDRGGKGGHGKGGGHEGKGGGHGKGRD